MSSRFAYPTRPITPAGRTFGACAGVGRPVAMKVPTIRTNDAPEVLAGYWLVECDSFDRATEIAARLSKTPYPGDPSTAYADVRPIAESRQELDI